MPFVSSSSEYSYSVIALIVANLTPLVGVFFWGWEFFPIFFFYWLESVVVGLYTVLKMVTADKGRLGAIFLVPFFLVHYGIFTAVHGTFVFALFGPSTILLKNIILAGITLFVSHGISYFSNFIGKKEYLAASPNDLMGAPYRRVVVMHLTIIFGGIFLKAFGAPFVALLLLICLKTCIDVMAHLQERSRYRASGTARPV